MDTQEQIKALLEDLQLTRVELRHANERIASLLGRDTPLVMRLALTLASTVEAYQDLARQTEHTPRRAGTMDPVIDEAADLLKEIRTGTRT